MALGRLTSFTFGNSFLTLVYANSQTYYVSYAHIIAGESDSRSGDLTIWIYTAGEVGETLSVKNSDLVAIGSSAAAFLALFNQNIQPYSYWQDFLDSTTASGALPSEPSALRGQCLYARFRPIYNFGSASLINVPARFKAGTLYSQVPDTGAGDFTVTRATTPTAGRSTRINKDGLIELVADNVPRLDYPLGGAVNGCPALLVEPSAQNLVQRSEEFNDGYWNKVRCTASANQTTAPNGTLTADKLIMNNGILPTVADTDGILRNEVITSGAYRFSIFAKAAEFTGFKVRENAVVGNFMDVNLTNGAITNPDTAQFISPLAQNYGNGWYRISWTSPTITNLNKYSIRVGSTGNGTSGIFIWGYQVETGSVATSYIPTAASPVTRGAETISKTGVSSLIGQTEGTIYAEVVLSRVNSNQIISLGSTNDRIAIFFDSSTGIYALIRVGATNADYNATIPAIPATGGVYKIALAYKANDYCFAVNGVTYNPSTASRGVPANMSAVYLGASVFSTGQLNDRIRALALYPTRLTNAQLATLTAP